MSDKENPQDIIDKMRNRPGELVLEELIDQAFNIFANKLSYGGIIAKNEFAFQFEFGNILKTLGQLYEFKLEDKFHLEFETSIVLNEENGKTKKARIDLLITYRLNNKITRVAIELKFFKKGNSREPNNRYDAFKDILYLESYKKLGIEMCYFLLVTNHSHYVNQVSYSNDTSDFDLRHGQTYNANKVLSYRTAKPHGPDIKLSQDYKFYWRTLEDINYLKVKV